MRPLTEQEIRGAFVNRTKGQVTRLYVPRDLAERPWEDLDFLGWRDPGAPDRACLATELDGRPVALALRCPRPAPGRTRPGMCSICMTVHAGGVSLMVAPRAGRAGQSGNTVGAYICGDLACPLYVRGKLPADGGVRLPETLSREERIGRTVANLTAFLAKVTAGTAG